MATVQQTGDLQQVMMISRATMHMLLIMMMELLRLLQQFHHCLIHRPNLWKHYGFVDAFNLKDLWFADSFLAIDQGPQIVMIENYRSGLLWNLFMSCPEVKRGMKQLGFQ